VADSTLGKANAHIYSMQRKQILEDASEYCQQVSQNNIYGKLPALITYHIAMSRRISTDLKIILFK
jgi:hypothetical protein